MAAATADSVYINGDFSEPLSAQHNFANHYNMDDPMQAMTSYARDMHRHTKKQMEISSSASRRSQTGSSFTSSLTPESSQDSVDSRRSR
ncbi:MAG: hypothetical protein M1837_001472 [Sclerophora amabilis]|nr:MAG: hypothetical protein M1837_001472 [Sclerophora amabilis]